MKIQPVHHVVFPTLVHILMIYLYVIFVIELLKIIVSFQYIDFYGRHESLFGTGDLKPKSETEVVAEMKQPEIEAGKTFLWENLNLRIPPLPPSRLAGCSIIDIRYVIKVSSL